jgi:hypothetical protein
MTLEETAKSTLRDAIDQGRESAEKARRAAKHGYEAAQEFAENEVLNFDLRGFVRREPWLALAAAFAIGYVAAQIVRRVS